MYSPMDFKKCIKFCKCHHNKDMETVSTLPSPKFLPIALWLRISSTSVTGND